jgi:hypothetical protein
MFFYAAVLVSCACSPLVLRVLSHVYITLRPVVKSQTIHFTLHNAIVGISHQSKMTQIKRRGLHLK